MDANTTSSARLYGGAIAVVSGGYSLWLRVMNDGLLMALLGAVVLAHGLLLFLSPERLAGYSGPLMVVWAAMMLLNQTWAWWAMVDGMGSGMSGGMDGGMGASAGMSADPGMVAIALIMLASGVIMWTTGERGEEME